MLTILPDAPVEPLLEVPVPAQPLPVQTKQPTDDLEEATVANEQEPRKETVFPPAGTEAEVEVFTWVDLLPVLVAAGWLLDWQEDDTHR
jgi:hypothetical protein